MRISSNVPVNEADTWAVLTALSNKNKTLESLISSVFVSRKTFNQWFGLLDAKISRNRNSESLARLTTHLSDLAVQEGACVWRGIVCEAVDEIVLEQFLRHLLHELVCDVSSAYSRLTPYPPTSYLFVSRRSGESHCKLCFLPTANIPITSVNVLLHQFAPTKKKYKKMGENNCSLMPGKQDPKTPVLRVVHSSAA